nr:WYL domain-containing protein [Rhodococcus sp. (in: high G+C Gram-positive bacteria)]
MQKTSARLLALLSLLQARRDWPGASLAERLDISPRTVRRDIDRLRELGYPISAFKGPDGGYRLAAGTEMPPLLFDDDQAVALAVALRTAAATGAGIEEAALRALETVRQVMPARLRRKIDFLQVSPAGGNRDQVDTAVLQTLSGVVHATEILRFDYEGSATVRRVEPHHLVSRDGRWYLIGFDLDREDWRTFRADRVTPRIPTGPRFVPRRLPTGDVATYVDSRFRGSVDGAWTCVGTVILDLPESRVWPFTSDGIVESVGENRCRLVKGSWSWTALAAALGQFDCEFEIVGPDALRDACAALAQRYARTGGLNRKTAPLYGGKDDMT